MAGYVSPFGNNTAPTTGSTPKKRSTNYISPFEGSVYTEDYWKKRQEEDQVKQQKKQAQERVAKADENLKKAEQAKKDVWSPASIIGELGKATGTVAKSIVDFGKSVTVDPAVTLFKQAETSGKAQANNNGKVLLNDKFQKNQEAEIDRAFKAGEINKKRADELRTQIQTAASKSAESVKKAEKSSGVKFNQSEGALGLIDTASNLSGLGPLAKSVFVKATEAAAKRLGRDLTKEEVENLARQTKSAVPEKTPEPSTTAPLTPKTPEIKPTVTPEVMPTEAPSVSPIIEAPKPTQNVALENTLITAAKTQAEKRLGRELTPPEMDNLTQQTKKLVTDKMPVPEPTPITSKELSVPKVETPQLKPEGDTISGNAARIEQKALEKKLTEKMGDLPQYKSINMKEQAKEAVDLINTDKQKAIDIIEGRANAPGNLKAQSVHQALEDLAVREGDGELLTKLAKSHINTELSENAQNLRIAAERDPHSAVEQIRQIRDARLKAAEKRAKRSVSNEAKDIRKKVEAGTPKATKQDWNSFIKELTC